MERFDIFFHKGSGPHAHPHAPLRHPDGRIIPGSGQAGWTWETRNNPAVGAGGRMTAAQEAAQAAAQNASGANTSPSAAAAQDKANQMADTANTIVKQSPTLGGNSIVGGGSSGSGGSDRPDPDEETPEEETPEETAADNSLLATLQTILAQFGLDTPGLLNFAKEAVTKGWTETEFILQLRQHPDYLKNPLYAANVERAKNGQGWMPEGQVLAWGAEARRIAKQYGYNAPSDNYLASGLVSGLSMAEIEHRFQIQDRINLYGAGVRIVAEEMGFPISDQDLFEIFDPERDTAEWDTMFRQAQMRGRPLTLGLGIRSEVEARAWEMMGLSPDEVFKRLEGVASDRPRFEKWASIEGLITEGLPDDFGARLAAAAPNSLLMRAWVDQDPAARAEWQQMAMREAARFKVGASPVSSQGQLTGLLSGKERQSFG